MIALNKVGKVYPHPSHPVEALKDISLSIGTGSFCLVMGPSGCGKSTLLNLLGGLDAPTSGEILFNGKSTADFKDGDWTALRRFKIGMIFQFFNLLPMLTAAENVALPLLLRGDPANDAREKAAQTLNDLGLGARLQHLPSALSGGEMQRVAIARALAISPQLLLADEPTGNLDSRTGRDILARLAAQIKASGVTLLMATHSEQARGFADEIIVMKDSKIDRIENLR